MRKYLYYASIWAIMSLFWIILVYAVDKTLKIYSFYHIFIMFSHWLLITTCYYVAKMVINKDFCGKEKISFLYGFGISISCLPVILIGAFAIQSLLSITEINSDGEEITRETISFTDLAIPMIISSFTGIFVSFRAHNSRIDELSVTD